jgi:hypothetical protein
MIQRAEESGDGQGGREASGPVGLGELRAEILEPHASLRYVARLFKWLAALLLLLLVAETVLGLVQQGPEALPVLLVEATRLIVFAGVLGRSATSR